MSRINYNILGTGSAGNAVIIEGKILIDCGVPYCRVEPYIAGLKIVLLTHIHGDHYKPSTVSRLAAERPMLRFGAGQWLAAALAAAGVKSCRIDILRPGNIYGYSGFAVEPVTLLHNVPNQGYKICLSDGRKLIYATDTYSLDGIEAKEYDLYLVEADYEEKELAQRMRDKLKAGEYSYEKKVLLNHMSRERCDDWIYQNIGAAGEYVYMHQHRKVEKKNG